MSEIDDLKKQIEQDNVNRNLMAVIEKLKEDILSIQKKKKIFMIIAIALFIISAVSDFVSGILLGQDLAKHRIETSETFDFIFNQKPIYLIISIIAFVLIIVGIAIILYSTITLNKQIRNIETAIHKHYPGLEIY